MSFGERVVLTPCDPVIGTASGGFLSGPNLRSGSAGYIAIVFGHRFFDRRLKTRRIVYLGHQLPGRHGEWRPIQSEGELAAQRRRQFFVGFRM